MHGTEKMIYDARMEPQALLHRDVLYIVYQADRTKSIGNPHIISYDTKRQQWSEPVQIATVPRYDHYHLTNMPSLTLDDHGNPAFLLLISDKTPTDCVFHFVRRQGDKWIKTPIARTVSTWAGSHLRRTGPGQWSAILVVGKDGEIIPGYGGGAMQEWVSEDSGKTWRMARALDPEPGLIYNNPSPAWTSDGKPPCPGCGNTRDTCRCDAASPVPTGDGVVRVARESKGRRGKTVTVVRGLVLAAGDLDDLARDLKRLCGTGGTVKDGAIEIQGDQRDRVVSALGERGFTVKHSGG